MYIKITFGCIIINNSINFILPFGCEGQKRNNSWKINYHILQHKATATCSGTNVGVETNQLKHVANAKPNMHVANAKPNWSQKMESSFLNSLKSRLSSLNVFSNTLTLTNVNNRRAIRKENFLKGGIANCTSNVIHRIIWIKRMYMSKRISEKALIV